MGCHTAKAFAGATCKGAEGEGREPACQFSKTEQIHPQELLDIEAEEITLKLEVCHRHLCH